jgi:hypothetical protein
MIEETLLNSLDVQQYIYKPRNNAIFLLSLLLHINSLSSLSTLTNDIDHTIHYSEHKYSLVWHQNEKFY